MMLASCSYELTNCLVSSALVAASFCPAATTPSAPAGLAVAALAESTLVVLNEELLRSWLTSDDCSSDPVDLQQQQQQRQHPAGSAQCA